MFGLFKKLFKRRIRYHDVKKFLNTNDLFFDVGAHLGDKSKELIKILKNPYVINSDDLEFMSPAPHSNKKYQTFCGT